MNAAVDRNFSNDPIALPISTQVFGDKISNISRRDFYTRCRVNLSTYYVNPVATQFVNHGLSAINTLNKSSGIWIPATRIIRSPDATHWSAADHAVGQGASDGDAMGKNQTIVKKTIKLILKFEWKIQNFNLSAKILKGVDNLWIRLLLVQKHQTQKHQK